MDPGTQLLRRETSKDKTLGLVKSLGWGPHMTIQVLGWGKQQWEQWHMLAVTAGTQWLWVPVISTTGPREQLCVSGWSLNLESLFMPNPKFVNLECLSAPVTQSEVPGWRPLILTGFLNPVSYMLMCEITVLLLIRQECNVNNTILILESESYITRYEKS